MNLNNIAAERCASADWLPPWTHFEHQCRYDFAAKYVAGKNVVDCASGSGFSSFLFASSGATKVIAVDASEDAVKLARSEYMRDNLEFIHGDATSLPIHDGWADVFISLETIEHVNDENGYISEIARVLKPEGLLLCSTPNRDICNPGTLKSDLPWNPHHVREYSREEFFGLFAKDFVIEETLGQNPVALWRVFSVRQFSKIVGKSLAVRLNQFIKCRWFIIDKLENHSVEKMEDYDYEYFLLKARRSK